MSDTLRLETDRLHLRQFHIDDAQAVQRLAGDWDVAKMTLNIPHPYEDGMAEEWIERQKGLIERGELVRLAVTLKSDGALIGAISLGVKKKEHSAELGYWIGKPYWNMGYCTEAGRALVDYGFQVMNLNRIEARHMMSNPASGRVMQKLGMTYEGTHRQAAYRSGAFDDLAVYAILRVEYRPV